MDTTSMPDNIPTIYPDDSARARRTDPLTSHHAADNSVKRTPAKLAIERVLADTTIGLTADEIWHRLRNHYGFYCSKERVRTALNEGAGLAKRTRDRFNAFTRLEDTGLSDNGNPAHLWTLAGGEA